MAGTITRLSFQKRNSERVNVHLDGRYAFAVPAMEAAKLKRGQFLSEAEIARLRALDARQRAYERVLRLLSHRPRSETEVQRYLKRKETPPEAIAEVLERLQREGYLDDAEFVRFWVENRERHNPRGVWALRQELRQTWTLRMAPIERSAAGCASGRDWNTRSIAVWREATWPVAASIMVWPATPWRGCGRRSPRGKPRSESRAGIAAPGCERWHDNGLQS